MLLLLVSVKGKSCVQGNILILIGWFGFSFFHDNI